MTHEQERLLADIQNLTKEIRECIVAKSRLVCLSDKDFRDDMNENLDDQIDELVNVIKDNFTLVQASLESN